MSPIDAKLVFDSRWTAVTMLDVDAATVATWDDRLVRDVRLLVPVDVQALVVTQDSEPMVTLPSALNDPSGEGPGFPPPFDAGARRAPGVHLHWAMPDALLRGRLAEGTDRNRLALPALPDRWVVLRLLALPDSETVHVRGWVLEADRAARVDLATWPDSSPGAPVAGAAVPADQLTGTAGGAATWSATYDSVLNRFGFHDPLDDLAQVAPQGLAGDGATYLVAGWWSQTVLDPLDTARDAGSLDALLHGLGWSAVAPWVFAPSDQRIRDTRAKLRLSVNLPSATIFATNRMPTPIPRVAEHAVSPLAEAVQTELVRAGDSVLTAKPWWPHATLLHGSVYGVPVETGPDDGPDNRPAPDDVRMALGFSDDDVLAALTGPALGPADDDGRRATERLLAAFTSHTLRDLTQPNGVAAAEDHEHSIAFGSYPGGNRGDDRLVTGRSGAALKLGRGARQAARRAATGSVFTVPSVRLSQLFVDRHALITSVGVRDAVSDADGASDPPVDTEPRTVPRPAPVFHFPLDPLVAVQGGGRSLRHGGDGRFSPDGLLWCRWPHQMIRQLKGVVRGSDVLPTLGNGSLPPEVLGLAQEAVLHSPYTRRWLADRGSKRTGLRANAVAARLDAEAVLRFGSTATYDAATSVFVEEADAIVDRHDIADQLWRHSLFIGVDPSPVGVTAWSQPWTPTWLEWEATAEVAVTLDDWQLDAADYEPVDGAAPATRTRTFVGRTLLTAGAADTLASAVRDFLAAEDAMEKSTGGMGEVPDDVESGLAAVAAAVENLDVLTAALDGIRMQLLGVGPQVSADGLMRERDGGGSLVPPAPIGAPLPLASGTIRVEKARLLDIYGRTLDVPAAPTAETATRVGAGEPGLMRIRPRLPRPARWMFRLVEAGGADDPLEARVDQVDPSGTVNPVAGFVLPDHLDESLEVFDAAGAPVGELFHEAVGNRVVWEMAPGRPGPPDSGPLFGLTGGALRMGRFATGLLAADVAARAAGQPAESALTAALRAIDTTLWTVDTFAALGSEHIAGLVGRPLALVRARLWLDLRPETDLDLSDPQRAAERTAAERALAAEAFAVRLGELTRTDDGLIGFFVGDDFTRLHVVDKVVAALAAPAGPEPYAGDAPVPIDHDYVLAEDTLRLHYGQRLDLMLLMHPGGQVNLTSGVLPRKALALAREWVAPGLARLSPSLRTGPVLLDTDQVRLPKPSAFGTDQVFTRRSSPGTWQDDPILAATQAALLPDEPAHVQDGYIRVGPGQAPTSEPGQ
ncbi:hypothetical protein [Mycolicibacterium stellerae]|uniref:hypothetical protein n=1 Tax=Mycolicibacterium stellerae TaxID=2358193 RepID=UPI000F0B6666|nr:hypothetical protein [Mycolicibacterium stellerae]